jgi:hypothetical protein
MDFKLVLLSRQRSNRGHTRAQVGTILGPLSAEQNVKPRYATQDQAKRINKIMFPWLLRDQGVGGSNLSPRPTQDGFTLSRSHPSQTARKDGSAEVRSAPKGWVSLPHILEFAASVQCHDAGVVDENLQCATAGKKLTCYGIDATWIE